MSLPEKLLEKAFYWGPLFVGVVSLIAGVVFVQTVYKFEGEIPLAQLHIQSKETRKTYDAPRTDTPQKVARHIDKSSQDKPLPLQKGLPLKARDLAEDKSSKTSDNHTREKSSSDGDAPSSHITAKVITPKNVQTTLPKKQRKEEQSVRATIPQLVALQSKLIGAEAGLALSGFEHSFLRPSLIGFEYSGSILAHWGNLSQFGLRQALRRSEHIVVMADAALVGAQGEYFISGLKFSFKNSIKPLIAHYGHKIGGKSPLSQTGFQLSLVAGTMVQRQFLISQGTNFGAIPKVTAIGLTHSMEGSERLLQHFQLSEIGHDIGNQISFENLAGIKRAVSSAEKMKVAAIALATAQKLSLKRKGQGPQSEEQAQEQALENLPCSDRFYAALQDIRSSKISSIRTVARPISTIDKTLPGKWVFTPPSFRTRSICKKYKYKRSGKRRCVKWSKSRSTNTSYTDDERDYILAAQKLIRGKGRHPMVKPRSPSHWVINIVAQNLNSYSSQKSHPALCTGALGMLDYFEGNLNRLRKHMLEMASLNEQSKAHILNKVERLNVSLNKQVPLEMLNNDEASFTQNQRIVISSYDPITVNAQAVAALFGEDVGLEILSRNNFIEAMRLTRTLLTSRKPELHESAYRAILRLATILEASYYIQNTNEKYKQLEQKLFGSLRGIRTAHSDHCNCSN